MYRSMIVYVQIHDCKSKDAQLHKQLSAAAQKKMCTCGFVL